MITLMSAEDSIKKYKMFFGRKEKFYIPVYSIIYAEVLDHILTVHTMNGSYDIIMSMEEFEKEMEDFGMIRVHKSFIVNYRYIISITSKDVVLYNDIKIPLSKNRVKEVENKLAILFDI